MQNTPSIMYTALPSCSYLQPLHSLRTIPQGPTFRDRRSLQVICANGSNKTTEQELQDTKSTELKEEMVGGCTRASMKKVACSVLASATLMWSSLAVGMAESATTPYSQSQSDRLQIGLINGWALLAKSFQISVQTSTLCAECERSKIILCGTGASNLCSFAWNLYPCLLAASGTWYLSAYLVGKIACGGMPGESLAGEMGCLRVAINWEYGGNELAGESGHVL